MPARMREFLERHIASRHYASWVALVSFGLTLVPSVPFGAVLCSAVLLDNRRWVRIWLLSSVAAAAGSLILFAFFHHLGWDQLVARFPDIVQSGVYARVSGWVSAWGVWALFLVTVIPLPQTPALAVCAVVAQPLPLAFLALLGGKGLRYGAYAWLAAKSPQKARAIAARYGI